MNERCRLVLDTTYLLPFLGIGVAGLSEDEVVDLSPERELFYPTMLIPELWAKVVRESEGRGMDRPPAEAASAMEALLAESG